MYKAYPHTQPTITISGSGPIQLTNISIDTTGNGVSIQGIAPALNWKPEIVTPNCNACLDNEEYCFYCGDSNPDDGEFYDEDYNYCGGCGECNECIS